MFQIVPPVLVTVRTGILEGLASGASWDIPSSPVIHGTVRTGILEGLTSGTSLDVPSSLSYSWDCQDWVSRGDSIWDSPGCPK